MWFTWIMEWATSEDGEYQMEISQEVIKLFYKNNDVVFVSIPLT